MITLVDFLNQQEYFIIKRTENFSTVKLVCFNPPFSEYFGRSECFIILTEDYKVYDKTMIFSNQYDLLTSSSYTSFYTYLSIYLFCYKV